LRSKVKVSRRLLRYTTHRLMVMHPHTKYHWPIWKDKKVMVRTSSKITSIRLYTPLHNPLRWLHGVCNLIDVISSWRRIPSPKNFTRWPWKSIGFQILLRTKYVPIWSKSTSIRLYTPLHNPLRWLHGVCNLIDVISSWTEQKLRSILNYYIRLFELVMVRTSFTEKKRKKKKKSKTICLPSFVRRGDIII
jgi:hypothetical protein